MKKLNPLIIMIGEAPGYKGCKLTGIPFTSEEIMMSENHFGLFGSHTGYNVVGEHNKYAKENSSTIVWNTYLSNELCPLMWNAFPFHPHKIDNQHSNRTPNKDEIEIGNNFLKTLLIEFPTIKYYVAVGNKADKCLDILGIKHIKIRHPSMGGKQEFIRGVMEMKKLHLVGLLS